MGLFGLALSVGSDWLASVAPLALSLPLLGFLGRLGGSGNGTRPLRPEARVTELEHELERLRTVIRQTASLNATLDHDRVLERVLDVCASAISNGNPEDQRLVSVLLLVAGEHLEVETARAVHSRPARAAARRARSDGARADRGPPRGARGSGV